MQLAEQVALLVGGAGGIGRAIALAVARAGADVVIADVDQIAGQEVVSQVWDLGRRGLFLEMDVTDESSVAGGVRGRSCRRPTTR